MDSILKTDDLIELHEQLQEFALYHQNKGGQAAHVLIKNMAEEKNSQIADGSPAGIARSEGFNEAISSALALLRKNFIG
jgi:hypothetical protein